NQIEAYGLLLVAAVIVFSGEVRTDRLAWAAAIAIVAVCAAGQYLLAPPRIDEGNNVFLPGGPTQALERLLPAEVYRQMAAEFEALYPPSVRCKPGRSGCWQDENFPDKAFAFSADGIWHKSPYSRSVTELYFSDPVWQHLGFTNDVGYNWYTPAPDVHRNYRDRRFWMGLHRWHLAMPWYEVIRLPAAYVGGSFCWRGEVMRENSDGNFSRWNGDGCRTIEAADAGRSIFGIAIKPDTLVMRITPPLKVRLLRIAQGVIVVAAVAFLILLLVRIRRGPARLAFLIIGLALLVIVIDDASFLGGLRPLDGGDDGLVYEGYGRLILEYLMAGNFSEALRGCESAYYYAPGLRYFRALEHIVFGDSFLGYLSLIMVLPFVVLMLFRRFLPERWSLTLVLLFVAVPIGTIYGTTFDQYVKWASKGFADPAAYIFFLSGILSLLGRKPLPAFFGSLLFALAVFTRPVVSPAVAVFLGGVGIFALYRREWLRCAALCTGFLPVFLMPLHNWYFGHMFLMFTNNSVDPAIYVMPAAAYVAAWHELLAFNFAGGSFAKALVQMAHWLSGPAESYWTIPLNAASVVIVGYVVARGRNFDPWLRLLGGAALAQHVVAFFYVGNISRYHFLSWFLTMLVVMVFMHDVGIGWLQRRYPALSERIANHPMALRLASGLSRLQKSAA
ncbi:MAG TPA: hypothetical protein VIJ78_11650, partial [Pseudolabrys sp.]